MPDRSTLCKFTKRLTDRVVEEIIHMFSAATKRSSTVIADSTGLSNFEHPAHFKKRHDNFGKRLVRTFINLSQTVQGDHG